MEIWSTEVFSEIAHFCGPTMDQLLWTNFYGLTSVDQLLWTSFCGPTMDQHIWYTAEVSHCSGCRNTKLQYLNSATGTSDSNIWVSISLTSTVDLENLSINIWPEHLTQISELVYLWLKFVPSRNTFLLRQCMNLTPQSQNVHFYLIGVICRLVIWSEISGIYFALRIPYHSVSCTVEKTQLRNIARGTTDPGYWLFNLSYLSS